MSETTSPVAHYRRDILVVQQWTALQIQFCWCPPPPLSSQADGL